MIVLHSQSHARQTRPSARRSLASTTHRSSHRSSTSASTLAQRIPSYSTSVPPPVAQAASTVNSRHVAADVPSIVSPSSASQSQHDAPPPQTETSPSSAFPAPRSQDAPQSVETCSDCHDLKERIAELKRLTNTLRDSARDMKNRFEKEQWYRSRAEREVLKGRKDLEALRATLQSANLNPSQAGTSMNRVKKREAVDEQLERTNNKRVKVCHVRLWTF